MEPSPTGGTAMPATVADVAVTRAADTAVQPLMARLASTKAAMAQKLLQRAKGASIAEIGSATSWQPHSCRAFLSGLRKQGAVVTNKQRLDGTLLYRIAVDGQKMPAA